MHSISEYKNNINAIQCNMGAVMMIVITVAVIAFSFVRIANIL